MLGFGGVVHVFRSDFRQKCKNNPITLFEWPKADKIWKSKNGRNPRKWRKKWPFGAFKTAKLSRFSRYQLEILYTYSWTSVLSHLLRF